MLLKSRITFDMVIDVPDEEAAQELGPAIHNKLDAAFEGQDVADWMKENGNTLMKLNIGIEIQPAIPSGLENMVRQMIDCPEDVDLNDLVQEIVKNMPDELREKLESGDLTDVQAIVADTPEDLARQMRDKGMPEEVVQRILVESEDDTEVSGTVH